MKKKLLLKKILSFSLISCLLLFISIDVNAQSSRIIEGIVLDSKTKDPLIGASVIEQGTTTGTVTDVSGKFTLKVTNNSSILVVSYLGYNTKNVPVNTQSQIEIRLEEDLAILDEVVVVGYGVQKKVNLTGAVAAVDGSEITEKRNANALASLQGVVPGLTVLRNEGRPGSETSGLQVRGLSSANEAAALVLIDGVEGDLAILNPEDIESVSVLKDAAASAIYGARAAAGVILVTTKKGRVGEKVRISYNGSFGINLPSRRPERVTAWDEQTLINLSRINAGVNPETGAATGNREMDAEQTSWIGNPNYNYRPNGTRWGLYESTNWIAEGMKDETLSHDHSISAMGGSEKTQYYMSFGYHYKDGILKYGPDSNERTNLRLSLNTELSKYVSVDLLATYQNSIVEQSSYGSNNVLTLLYSNRGRQPIYQPDIDSNYSVNPYNGDLHANPIDIMKNSGFDKTKTEYYTGKIGLHLKNFVKGLTVDVNASRRASYYAREIQKRELAWPGRNGVGQRSTTGSNYLTKTRFTTYLDKVEALVNYDYQLNDHAFHVLLGTSYEESKKDQISGKAMNQLSNDFFSFNFYDSALATNSVLSDLIEPWKMASIFGRATYNYKERYLFEANVRYDGSSRLDPDYRWDIFPSFSAAWRVSEEQWFEPFRDQVNNLKARVSWGRLGNSSALDSFFSYIGLITDKDLYSTNTTKPVISIVGNPAYYQHSMVSRELSWEILESTNIGLDLGLLSGKLNFTGDYYWKKNKNMLAEVKVGNLVGAAVPYQNVGELKAWGWEVSANWNHKIGNVSYSVGVNLEDAQNEVTKYAGLKTVEEGHNKIIEGYPINSIWGYKTDGYWSSRQEYLDFKEKNPGYESFNDNMVTGGDVKYLAQGKANHVIGVGGGTPGDSGDLVYLGSTNGRYMFGINLNAQWKGFDVSMFFQGVGKRKIILEDAVIAPFTYSYQMPWTIHLDYWTEDNPNAFFPRLINMNNYNYKPSDKWVQDGSYIRLKNIQVGYTIPVSKKYIQNLRVYVAGTDVWEHTNLLDVMDPEVKNKQGRNFYPFFRTWTTGINITF